MDCRRLEIPIPEHETACSLCWNGDYLVDWPGGNRVYSLDGQHLDRRVGWSYRFDAAVQSRSGRYAAIYERLGTKALLLDRGKLVRELNRSFYCAGSYEYPIAFLEHPDGRELIAHCPDEYNQLEIDEVASGKRLTVREGQATDDFFHSRLAVSPDGRRLLSAGWFWHPFDSVSTWSIAAALEDGGVLNTLGPPRDFLGVEASDATFIDGDRLLISANPDAQGDNLGGGPFVAGSLAIVNLNTGAFESVVMPEARVGSMLWLGDDRVVGFFEHPKVIDVKTGKVLAAWPDIPTGKRDSSFIPDAGALPAIAMDVVGRRFAVASKGRITVIQFTA